MGRPKGSKNKPKVVETCIHGEFEPVQSTIPKVETRPWDGKEPVPNIPKGEAKSYVRLSSDPQIIKYQIVEVDKPRPNLGWDKESRETVMTLAAHPGFLVLLQKLSTQAALLRAKLVNDRHKEIKDVEFIQSGIFWCNWLQSQLTAATQRVKAEPQAAMDEEARAFKELQATLNKVGEDE
jgi:hypothetical protein